MSKYSSPSSGRLRRKPIPACLASLFAFSASSAGATQVVNSCLNDGAGSLRQAVLNAANSGDVVDASGLNCSSITLTTGAIVVNKTDLTIQGPGASALTITGKYNGHSEPYRIFTHYGSGKLTLKDMTITKGYVPAASFTARGGCIFSFGSVELDNVNVTFCSAKATGASSTGAQGGALYVQDYLKLSNSSVQYSTANGYTASAAGGGIFTKGDVIATDSTIAGNSAIGNTGTTIGFGGGLYSKGLGTYLYRTTVSNNTAGLSYGGIFAHNLNGTLRIGNSTISGNTATAGNVGGLYASQQKVYLYNSTVAFNSAGTSTPGQAGAGVAVYGGGSTPTALFSSTLIANNTYGAAPTNKDLSSSVTITGSNNLIRVPDGAVPADTIVGKCPLLGPLHANGGPTKTHALQGHSPALDAGIDAPAFSHDQRGSPYARKSGPPGAATALPDIGAFEVDRLDKIFDATFEGCT